MPGMVRKPGSARIRRVHRRVSGKSARSSPRFDGEGGRGEGGDVGEARPPGDEERLADEAVAGEALLQHAQRSARLPVGIGERRRALEDRGLARRVGGLPQPPEREEQSVEAGGAACGLLRQEARGLGPGFGQMEEDRADLAEHDLAVDEHRQRARGRQRAERGCVGLPARHDVHRHALRLDSGQSEQEPRAVAIRRQLPIVEDEAHAEPSTVPKRSPFSLSQRR